MIHFMYLWTYVILNCFVAENVPSHYTYYIAISDTFKIYSIKLSVLYNLQT